MQHHKDELATYKARSHYESNSYALEVNVCAEMCLQWVASY